MWVQGDLKDQLGLKHRKARKTPNTNRMNTLEAAPMFQVQHSRSLSELSTRDQYEPANTSSPPPAQRIRRTHLDTPPMRVDDELPIVDITYKKDSYQETTHLAPYPALQRVGVTPSPQPSYYSASDIPIPSPLPPTQYKYPDGEVTTNPPSRRTSIGTARHAASQETLEYVETEAIASSSSQPPPLSPSPTMLHVPGSSSSNAFELHVMPPPDEYLVGTAITHGQPHERETTTASYTTADDDWISAEDASGVGAMPRSLAQSLHEDQHPSALRPSGRSPSPRAIPIAGDRRDGGPPPAAPWAGPDSGGWDGGVAL